MASETMENILAEMRTKAKHFEECSSLMVSESLLALFLYPLIDRIEAAAKREVPEASTQNPENCVVGNSAAMREALKNLDDEMTFCERNVELGIGFALEGLREHCRIVRQIINTALSEPPKNCDRHTGWLTAIKEFNDTEGRRKPWGDDVYDTRFLDWLFAPATERKGGKE